STRAQAGELSPFARTLRPIMTARLCRYARLRMSRRLGVAFVVDTLAAQVLAQEDVVLLALVVLLRVLALLGRHVRLLFDAFELVFVPPGADAVQEAHDGSLSDMS